MYLSAYIGLIIATIIGVAFGVVTGLAPGVHINLVSAILLSLAPLIAEHTSLLNVCALIMAMSVTHTFLDTIPSIFLGAPDDDKAMGVLPGHRYLLRGNGMMAVKLCVIGGLLGAILSTVLFVPIGLALKLTYTYGRPYLFWMLAAIVVFTVLKDKKMALAAAVFCISGALGLVVLRLPLRDPLLPLLSGMFGVATLLYSINEHQSIPPQKELCYTELDIEKTASGTVRGVFAGMITALLPGVSASAASAAVSQGGRLGDHGFLVLLGSLGSASFILSLASFWYFEKARNGAMAVITELSAIEPSTIILLLSTGLVAAGVASMLALLMGRSAARWLPKIPYRGTCIGVIIFVASLVLVRSGWLGLAVLITSTAVGLIPAAAKTARAQAMGCLLLPILVMLW
ncbi:TPA: hypothetical protein HA251_08230 [Candidatus Woesearchaeota archaeon]|nr:hypothetical protein [Candidatus Woesearchaeota archaeon]